MPRLLLLLVALLAACSTLHTGVDYDPSYDFRSLRTFGILEAQPGEGEAEDPRAGPLLDRSTEGAIDRVLTARGYALRSSGPVDFLVAYSNDIQRDEQRSSYSVGIGSSYGYFGAGSGISASAEAPLDASTRTFATGTLVLDVLDSSSHRLVFRGWAEHVFDSSSDPAARIDEAVRRIFAKFPPVATGDR